MVGFIVSLMAIIAIVTLVGLIHPPVFRTKWLSERPRIFAAGLLPIIILGLIGGRLEESELENQPPEIILTRYAQKAFHEHTAIDVSVIQEENPLRYRLTVNSIEGAHVTAEALRSNFFHDVSSLMRDISGNDRLKDAEGTHSFYLSVETGHHGENADTSLVVEAHLPGNMEFDWGHHDDISAFLKFLNFEQMANPEVKIKWRMSDAKPDYWR
jgi:hypothetical protein